MQNIARRSGHFLVWQRFGVYELKIRENVFRRFVCVCVYRKKILLLFKFFFYAFRRFVIVFNNNDDVLCIK
jgi:hypothetical protein